MTNNQLQVTNEPFSRLTLFTIYFCVCSVFSVAKTCVNLCKSVSNSPVCLSAFVAETQSIKNDKLCKTNPILRRPK
jgi:hypothetical protein